MSGKKYSALRETIRIELWFWYCNRACPWIDRKLFRRADGGEGLSNREAAKVLGVSDETVNRDSRATNVAPKRSATGTNTDRSATNVAHGEIVDAEIVDNDMPLGDWDICYD
jgi:hypothetical protein